VAGGEFRRQMPPIAPAPNTQMRRNSIFASDFTFGVISPALDSSMSSRWSLGSRTTKQTLR
jgi:hypothetical protein